MIGLTMGDPNGVGPELILHAAANGEICGDFFVIGDYEVMDYANQHLGYQQPIHRMDGPADWQRGFMNILDLALLSRDELTVGKIGAKAGAASRSYILKAADLALNGVIDAMVTLPVNKEAVRLHDPQFTGHTELIAQRCGVADPVMMLASDLLTVAHVTTHIGLADAIRSITTERIFHVICATHDALVHFREKPRLAVAGLNPHAGEGGAFGREEIAVIRPAIQMAMEKGIPIAGPEPPDTVFLKASRGHFDAVVCMYHDQGHIPLKLLDFEGGVNITLGLPIVRTSVDHGTAYDIAYQGTASTRSLVEAVKWALRFCGN